MVSVIVPTHKGAPVEACVEKVKASTYKDIEIIVVDEGLERSAQRNIGIDRAKGEYLLILDVDQHITPDLITNCVGIMDREPGCVGIYIPELIMTSGWFGRLRNWERQFYTGTCVDVVRFIRNFKCPRFDLSMSGPEDSDWDRLVGSRAVADYSLYHHDNIGVHDYLKKKIYYTKSMERYRQKHPNDKVLKWWYRGFWIFVENGKWKKFIKKPHYALALIGLIFIRGIIYTCRKK